MSDLAIDVTVTSAHSGTPAERGHAATATHAAAARAEQTKRRHYRAVGLSDQYHLLIPAFEALGGWGREIRAHLHRLCMHMASSHPSSDDADHPFRSLFVQPSLSVGYAHDTVMRSAFARFWQMRIATVLQLWPTTGGIYPGPGLAGDKVLQITGLVTSEGYERNSWLTRLSTYMQKTSSPNLPYRVRRSPTHGSTNHRLRQASAAIRALGEVLPPRDLPGPGVR